MFIFLILLSFSCRNSHAMQQQIAVPRSSSQEASAPGGPVIAASLNLEQIPYLFTLTRKRTFLESHGVVLEITLTNNATKHWIALHRFFGITHIPQPRSNKTTIYLDGGPYRGDTASYWDSQHQKEELEKIFARALSKFLEIETSSLLPDNEITKPDLTLHFTNDPFEPDTPLIEQPQKSTNTSRLKNLFRSYCTIQ